MTTLALVADTFREAFARLIFWGLFGLSTAMILFFLFLLKIDVVQGAIATMTLFGTTASKSMNVEHLVRQAYGGIATFLYTWGMLLSVFASAGLVPSLLEPGRIELLLSKPVGRLHLLLARYLGNVLVVTVNVAYLVLGVWLIFGAKTGIWSARFLYAIPFTVFIFSVLLAVVVLVGVAFDSPTLATMVTAGLMVASPILAQAKTMEKLLSSEWSRQLWKALYAVLPKVFDVGRMSWNLVRNQQPVNDWTPVWSSALFGLAVLAAGLVVFARRDF